MRDELRERRLAFEPALREHFFVGTDLDRVDEVAAFERLVSVSGVERHRVLRGRVLLRNGDDVRCARNATSSRPRAISCSITWISANRKAASVFGLIGTHCADAAPVTDRCGSTCTRFMPRVRASA